MAEPAGQNRHPIKPWSMGEIQKLRSLATLGAEAVADELDRSVWSVRKMAYRHRISLRQPGRRDGLVLGQPRGVSLKAKRSADASLQAIEEVRSAIAAGLVDPGSLERAVRRRRRLLLGEAVCPTCAVNPIERDTGLCDDCHWRSMADVHRRGETATDGQREYERERKRAQRARKAAS